MNSPAEFLQPDYAGGSIANVPGTVAALLDAPFQGLPPLRSDLWRPIAQGVKRVVVIIFDAWGWNLVEREEMVANGLLQEAAIVGQLTSVFPSTTVAALSSLWTGVAPAQHGMVGLRLFMPDYAVTAQMLRFTPTFGRYPDALIEAGLEPETFLDSPGFAEQLAAAGIETHAFKGREIIRSALSRMHGRGVTGDHGVSSMADMLVQMRQLLEERPGERLYVCGYWPTIDTLSHVYGWQHESVYAEARSLVTQLQVEFLEKLSPAARRDTAIFIVADHGQVVTPPAQEIYLEEHPELKRMLFMKPSGEPRTAYMHVKHGRQSEVVSYINERLGQAMVAYPAAEALGEGLLGPLPHSAKTGERVGDVLVAMRQGYVLLTEAERDKARRMRGRHGGMTRDEMLAPWLGFRLNG